MSPCTTSVKAEAIQIVDAREAETSLPMRRGRSPEVSGISYSRLVKAWAYPKGITHVKNA